MWQQNLHSKNAVACTRTQKNTAANREDEKLKQDKKVFMLTNYFSTYRWTQNKFPTTAPKIIFNTHVTAKNLDGRHTIKKQQKKYGHSDASPTSNIQQRALKIG